MSADPNAAVSTGDALLTLYAMVSFVLLFVFIYLTLGSRATSGRPLVPVIGLLLVVPAIPLVSPFVFPNVDDTTRACITLVTLAVALALSGILYRRTFRSRMRDEDDFRIQA